MDEIEYSIVFSRRRSISILVGPGKGVIVRAPFRTSLKTIEKFVQEKSPWIKKNIDRLSGLERINHGKKYIEGEPHLFLGREYILSIKESDKSSVRLFDNTIEAGLKEKDNHASIKSLMEKWYRKKAQELISVKMTEILLKYRGYNFYPSKVTVRALRSRWGSCTSKRKITINSELIKLNESFIEYVIIHELCHLKYHNHGKEFYSLLGELFPDYKAVRKALRKYLTE